MALRPMSGAFDACHALPRSPLSTNPTKAPARRDGQTLARRAARLFRAGCLSNGGRAAARGMAPRPMSGALDASHALPRSPLSTNPTKAPARRDGRALTRRTACLISGGVLERQREGDCPWDGAATDERGTLSMQHTAPPSPQHRPHKSASPKGRAGARPARCALGSGRGAQ